MNVSLDNVYHSELYFQPARNVQRKLIGLSVIANFVSEDGDVRIPTELVLPRLSPEEQCQLFIEKLALIETCQHFFIQHKLVAWIYITPAVVPLLLTNSECVSAVKRFSFLELMINENFPELSEGKENKTLHALAERFPLVLSNFGAGESANKAIFDGLFKRIILDRNFVHRRATRLSFEPFMRAILTQVSPYCESLMIAGIDSEAMLTRVTPFGFSGMQGGLWPAVSASQVTQLLHG
ncbi:EAL domain-containing protein [Citrobacter amalonaticus]|uniref:EAL domain-containing protein n=1 Tax=Citrobacter amalonaticus TaxID=35703 RepID=UPI00115A0FC3|nr:EAL domain-containing protein [Citrobacter amalonaticus]QDK88149.1 EAL domain-containing protein [Citrobacter amalonaticus]